MQEMQKMEKYKAIVIFGPPGSGKGTQAKLLSSDKKYMHFSTGEMCRSVDAGTELGKQIKVLIDNGNLIPDKIIVNLLKENIQQAINKRRYNPQKQILLLDGIPRNAEQAGMLSEFIIVEKIISLEIPDREIISRLQKRAKLENRKDDSSSDIIKNRINTYKKQTHSVLEKYPKDILVKINGVGPVEEVHKRVLASLKN